MAEMKVGRTTQKVTDDGRHRTAARFSWGDAKATAYFETAASVPFVKDNVGDLWVAPALLIAMRHNLTLRLRDPISNARREDLGVAQDIISTWFPERMSKVEIKAPRGTPLKVPPAARDSRVVGACFTGGVDSFHTLVKNRQRIGALLYGYGLDVPKGQREFAGHVETLLQEVAAETDVRLLTAETNIRRLLGRADVNWGDEGHGATLAALATLFSPLIRVVLVPSTHSYDAATPWGSHPMLDHRWSTRRLQVRYDGGECSRVKKTRNIADDPVVQKHLRVCYSQFEQLNCGRCSKCIRTMATLQVLGQLQNFSTFPQPLDLEHVRQFELRAPNDAARIRDVYNLARQDPVHAELADALGDMLERYDASIAPGTLSPVRATPMTPAG